jgi:predicted methyltransferase
MNRIALLVTLFLAGAAIANVYQDVVDHPGRPATDREDDDRRKPARVMAFAGVSAGEIVLEVGAGRGYTTELAARLVGPDGKVFAHSLDPARVIGNRLPNVITIPAQPADLGERFAAAGMRRSGVDRVLAFFSLHDFYLNDDNDMQRVYRTLLDYLKPGGEFVVMDNTAPAGSELTHTADLHRIDEAFLKTDILKAGFEFAGDSALLRNADDDLQSSWFEDTASRPAGYQDRFAIRFRKP